jgi:predicted RND superfamily exporter protein
MSAAEQERRSRWVVMGLIVVLTLAAIPGLRQVKVDRDVVNTLIEGAGEISATYERYRERFPADVGVIVVVIGDDLCTPQKWQALIELSQALEALPVVEYVAGLPTAKYVVGTEEAVQVREFTDAASADKDSICELARDYPPYRSVLITEDMRAMALYVRPFWELPGERINAEVESVVELYRPRFTDGRGGTLLRAGSPYLSAELARQTTHSIRWVGLAMMLMFVVAWRATGLVLAGVATVVCGIVSLTWTFALMGYVGVSFNPTNASVVQLLIPIGAAFTIHACGYVGDTQRWNRGVVPAAARGPFGFAVLTTMIGFGATAVSTVPNVRNFGLIGMFGIGACAATTFGMTFPLLSGRRAVRQSGLSQGSLPQVLNWAFRMSRSQTLMLVAVVVVLCSIGLARLRVNFGPSDYLLPANEVHRSLELVGEHFRRINYRMVIHGTGSDAALSPELWSEVRGFVREMEEKYPVRAVWAYDQVSQLSLAFTADDARPTALPDSEELLAQYLLLLDQQATEAFLDADRERLSVVFRVPWSGSAGLRPFQRDVDEFAGRIGRDAVLTGQFVGTFAVVDRVAVENVQSLAIGLALILGLLWILTRSRRVALIGTVVNAGPVLISLAFLGFAGIDLDLGSSVVSAVALGIVVDDTGHLIASYTRHRREGWAPEVAARKMVGELWRPVLTTSLAIVIGFSVMNFAEMRTFHTFSRTLSIAVVFALFGDLILLPALLIHFDRRRRGRARKALSTLSPTERDMLPSSRQLGEEEDD